MMPAKKMLDEFQFDPSTFNWDQFKAALATEIDGDTDLSNTKITQLTESNTGLAASERDLKVRLFDATVMKQGAPVQPSDSPAGAAADQSGITEVPDSDIFGTG